MFRQQEKRHKQMKQERTDKINTSKYKKQAQIYVGNKVLIKNHTKQCKFAPLFLAQPCSVIDVNRNYLTVTNDPDGKTFKTHRDDLKLLPFDSQTQDDLVKCRDNDSNTSYYRSRYDIENYGEFPRQIEEKRSDLERPFLFQDSCCAPREPDVKRTSRCRKIDEMRSGTENLCLNSALSPTNKIRQSKRTKRPNPRYYNQDIITEFDK